MDALENKYGVELDARDVYNLSRGQEQYDGTPIVGPLNEVGSKIDGELAKKDGRSRPAPWPYGLFFTEREFEIGSVVERFLVDAGLVVIPPPRPLPYSSPPNW